MIQTKTIITCDRCSSRQEIEVNAKSKPPRFFYETGKKFDLCDACRETFDQFMTGRPLETEKKEEQKRLVEQYLSTEELEKLGDIDGSEFVTLNPNIYRCLYAEAVSARELRGHVLTAWEYLAGYAGEDLAPVDCLKTVEVWLAGTLSEDVWKEPKQWLSSRLNELAVSDTIPSEPAPAAGDESPKNGDSMASYQRSPGLPYIR